jgi:hypothetical protein
MGVWAAIAIDGTGRPMRVFVTVSANLMRRFSEKSPEPPAA